MRTGAGTIALAVAAASILAPPAAAERRRIDPVAIHGNWFGSPTAVADDCTGDGYLVGLATYDRKVFMLSVSERRGGVTPPVPTETRMEVVPPPPNAPERIDVFLSGPGSKIGVVIRTGSVIELVPAGADQAYAATSLYLRRCL
jgi:hypothetical protein